MDQKVQPKSFRFALVWASHSLNRSNLSNNQSDRKTACDHPVSQAPGHLTIPVVMSLIIPSLVIRPIFLDHIVCHCPRVNSASSLFCTYIAAKRQRRSYRRCNKKVECCKFSYRLHFRAIGWNWVVAPPWMEINKCMGVCTGKTSTYSRALLALFKRRLIRRDELPCCRPLTLDSQSVITIRRNGRIAQKMLNIRVSQCACRWFWNMVFFFVFISRFIK